MTIFFRQQAVPVECAEKRPGRYCPDINSFRRKFVCRVPHLVEPSHLFLASTAEMGFGNCYWLAVTLPGLPKQNPWARGALSTYPHGFDIGVNMLSISAMCFHRIPVKA